MATKIEWTDETWNPTRGCSRVSEGCRNCYAERQAARFAQEGQPFHGFAVSSPEGHGARWTGKVELIPEKLNEPLRWRKPRRVFVDSMSDLFHETLAPLDVARVLNVIGGAPAHTFQVLTKRPKQMKAVMESYYAVIGGERPFRNLWLGVSVEDQKTADERIPLLLQTPAVLRFVSYEPALEDVHFDRWLSYGPPLHSLATSLRPRLDWLIVGGESGPNARPCDVAWIRSAVRQCKEAGVPVFVKQLGAKPYEHTPTRRSISLHDSKGGNPAKWPEDLRIRRWPK